MKTLSAAILIASVPLAPVLAEEVLHCADTNNAGFKWDKKGEVSPLVTFPLHRFTIKVGPTQKSYPFISDNERLITRTTEGMSPGVSELYRCTHRDQGAVCVLPLAPINPWLFANNGHYVRPFLGGGPPDSGFDPNIAIIYGTCTRARSD